MNEMVTKWDLILNLMKRGKKSIMDLEELRWHPEKKRGNRGKKRKRRRRKREEEQGRGNQLVLLLKYTLSCMSFFTVSYQCI